jgi:small subunit ribosomal protein S16
MALKIRLRQQGRRNRQVYRLVVTDVRTRRDGKYIEMLGWYDPNMADATNGAIKTDRIRHWLSVGAQLSENAHSFVKRIDASALQKD